MWVQAIVISQLALFFGVGQANREAWGTETSSSVERVALRSNSRVGSPRGLLVAKGPSARGGAGAAAGDPSTNAARSDTDLMLEALVRADGESPNAKKIDRAVAQAKADARRDQVAPATVWKDPFAEDPTRPIPVRTRRSTETKTKELAVVRRELARARAETAVAQADAARAKADAAKAEANAALAQAVAAKHEAVAARAACVDPSAGKRVVSSSLVRTEQRSRPRDTLVNAAWPRVARKSVGRAAEPTAKATPMAAAVDAPVAAAPAASTDPLIVPLADDALVSSHPGGGILVVPITR